ncbi:MAG: tetratricopeptide repeat protein [Bacteroidales bacterium]|nr:tetratricopeptide repeat protein [Bacteroidales bacterium]
MKSKLPAIFFILFLFSFLIGNQNAFSQNYNIDSLETLLKNNTEEKKIPYYYALTEYYIYNAPNKAIRLANELLIYAEKHDSTEIIDYCYQIIGEAYYLQENYPKALEYFKNYLKLQVEINNENGIGRAYNNLGIIYRATDDFPRAIECYEKSREIYEKLNNAGGLSGIYINLGVLHEYLNLFAQARDFYNRSLEIELKLKDFDGIATSYLNLGGIHLKLKNHKTAIEYCEKSIELCKIHDYTHTLELNYEILSQAYKEIDKPTEALNYLEMFNELKGIRINQEASSQIAELEIKYQADKKQQEIDLLNKEKTQKHNMNIVFIIGLLLFSVLVIVVLKINKTRRRNNNVLRSQNDSILVQKEEIEAQRDEIEAQRDEIKRQKDISDIQTKQIVKQNKDITDSIEYAKHIQIALFPNKITLQKVLKQGFCLFKPKDIVSGDFYWVNQMGNRSVIVAADCTGHGVPGAFMSIIGINFLNEIVFDKTIVSPNDILNELRKKIIKTMIHANRVNESKDGMDISLVVIDHDEMTLEYAGAFNNLFFIRDHMLDTIKADRMPVGISDKAITPFTNHKIKIQTGDLFYLFTDGYADQFGGKLRKKFRAGNLRELLLEMHEKDMPEQKRILHETFLKWKGDEPQVDDILAIGIRI